MSSYQKIKQFLGRNDDLIQQNRDQFPSSNLSARSNDDLFKLYKKAATKVRRKIRQNKIELEWKTLMDNDLLTLNQKRKLKTLNKIQKHTNQVALQIIAQPQPEVQAVNTETNELGNFAEYIPYDQYNEKSAFRGMLTNFEFDGYNIAHLELYLLRMKESYARSLKTQLFKHKGLNFLISVHCLMRKGPVQMLNVSKQAEENKRKLIKELILKFKNKTKNAKTQMIPTFTKQINPDWLIGEPYFVSKNIVLNNAHEIDQALDASFAKILGSLDAYVQNGSNWTLIKVTSSTLEMGRFRPFHGASYIPTPSVVPSRSVVNVQNKDNQCFKWAILSALYPATTNVCKTYNYENKGSHLTWLEFPMNLSSIPKWEKLNNISINVYVVENSMKHYVWQTSKLKFDTHIDLLYIFDDTNDAKHFAWIKDFNRFNGLKSVQHKTWSCKHCLSRFYSEEALQNHFEFKCTDMMSIKLKLPHPTNAIMKFGARNVVAQQKNAQGQMIEFHKQLLAPLKKKLKAPFAVYFDLESFLVKSKGKDGKEISNHVPCGAAFHTVCDFNDKYNRTWLYRFKPNDGKQQVVENLLQELIKEQNRIHKLIQNIDLPVNMTESDTIDFANATHCHICEEPLKTTLPHCDHCHFTGKYRGAAHQACNQMFNYGRDASDPKYFVPVYAHNFSGYDSHFIVQMLHNEIKNIKVIAVNSEKFMSLKFFHIEMLDSMRFMGGSLRSHIDRLKASAQKDSCLIKSKFKHMFNYFEKIYDFETILSLINKQVYPYEYMDCVSRFDETQWPDIEKFYSSLSKSTISEKRWLSGKKVFEKLKLKSLGEFHDLYLTIDVLTLADCFEQFKQVAYDNFGLEVSRYVSLPGFALDACLKMTKVTLDVFNWNQVDMDIMIMNNIRGGFCCSIKKLSTANNIYMKSYDRTKPSVFVNSEDARNLYGWAMKEYLPEGEYEWANDMTSWSEDQIQEIPDYGPYCYFPTVDLDYPEELHDLHNDLPLGAELCAIDESELSEFTRSLNKKSSSAPIKKLMRTFNPKRHYTCHFRSLKYYLQKGLKLKKIHCVMKCKQSPWLKPYIEYCTNKRVEAAKAGNKFLVQYWKDMINSVFGKFLENVRKRINYDIKNDTKSVEKLCAKPYHKRRHIISAHPAPSVVGIESYKTSVTSDKPITVGLGILELSRLRMEQRLYEEIKPKYGDRARLLYTDTDSYYWECETDDYYLDCLKDTKYASKMDFCDFPKFWDLSHLSKEQREKAVNLLLQKGIKPINLVFTKYGKDHPKLPGKMGDTLEGNIIVQFCSLSAKMYSYLLENPEIATECDDELYQDFNPDQIAQLLKEQKHAKGIKTSVFKTEISHQDYVDCVTNPNFESKKFVMSSFSSKRHNVNTITTEKVGLSNYDDKRYWINSIESRAHGHWRNKV